MKHSIALRVGLCLLAGLLVALLVSEGSFYFLRRKQDRQPETITLIIPTGTAARVAIGENPPSIPADLTFIVGDTLQVINQDAANHQLGPLFIPAGTTASLSFDLAQDYAYACSFRTDKYLGLTVQQPITLADRVTGVILGGLPLGVLLALYAVFVPAPKKETTGAA